MNGLVESHMELTQQFASIETDNKSILTHDGALKVTCSWMWAKKGTKELVLSTPLPSIDIYVCKLRALFASSYFPLPFKAQFCLFTELTVSYWHRTYCLKNLPSCSQTQRHMLWHLQQKMTLISPSMITSCHCHLSRQWTNPLTNNLENGHFYGESLYCLYLYASVCWTENQKQIFLKDI